MKLYLTRRQLLFTARYLITVLIAAIILIALRWNNAAGLESHLKLIANSVWQASVWPLYLLVQLAGTQ